ncbi:putative tyrosine phosphatase family protein [Heterostelium album PN500]|uniref:protein-tyrosine-phosphatase n=1 Tax=Heterostelium pallidum (strain ATCC 26659 / Pp 5 / PN500) TaxID=670386 RepID=D3AZX6_HETP5|nr:putative tyrosine phosphatase family protein [Heterostelium album PN500]EFA84600.1 putative tyrosine phosphatase family protein [Heterostelium album PN500]|eukprot:XP_020436713.1 putative tyrosine phosphatase family protein [Heterostelium album PN500]
MAHHIPPLNFGMVADDLYRSGQPNELNFPFLEKLQLKKIIFLAPDDPSQQFVNFCDDQDIELIHLGMDTHTNPWNPISEDIVISALKIVLDPDSYPLHIMCNLGRHRTGTVVGCLRKLQRWNLTSILEEYRRFAGSKVRLLNEQFIELFDTDLVGIPDNAPKGLYLN